MQSLDVCHQVMNVVIGVTAEEIYVRAHRRIYLVAHPVSWPRPVSSIVVGKSDREFIAIGQGSRNLLSVWQRDG